MTVLVIAGPGAWPIPFILDWRLQGLVLLAALALVLATSGRVVRFFVGRAPPGDAPAEGPASTRGFDAGFVIGKCENILVFVLVLAGQYEGLGFVLAAKSIARLEAIKTHASYYLGGTLVNLVFSLVVAIIVRLAVFGPVSS